MDINLLAKAISDPHAANAMAQGFGMAPSTNLVGPISGGTQFYPMNASRVAWENSMLVDNEASVNKILMNDTRSDTISDKLVSTVEKYFGEMSETMKEGMGSMTSRIVNSRLLSSYVGGNILDVAAGTQNVVMAGGMSMQGEVMYGNGPIQAQVVEDLTKGIQKYFSDSNGMLDYNKTKGYDLTDIGQIVQTLSDNGAFAGREAIQNIRSVSGAEARDEVLKDIGYDKWDAAEQRLLMEGLNIGEVLNGPRYTKDGVRNVNEYDELLKWTDANKETMTREQRDFIDSLNLQTTRVDSVTRDDGTHLSAYDYTANIGRDPNNRVTGIPTQTYSNNPEDHRDTVRDFLRRVESDNLSHLIDNGNIDFEDVEKFRNIAQGKDQIVVETNSGEMAQMIEATLQPLKTVADIFGIQGASQQMQYASTLTGIGIQDFHRNAGEVNRRLEHGAVIAESQGDDARRYFERQLSFKEMYNEYGFGNGMAGALASVSAEELARLKDATDITHNTLRENGIDVRASTEQELAGEIVRGRVKMARSKDAGTIAVAKWALDNRIEGIDYGEEETEAYNLMQSYFAGENVSLSDLGKAIGVTEKRSVSQIHARNPHLYDDLSPQAQAMVARKYQDEDVSRNDPFIKDSMEGTLNPYVDDKTVLDDITTALATAYTSVDTESFLDIVNSSSEEDLKKKLLSNEGIQHNIATGKTNEAGIESMVSTIIQNKDVIQQNQNRIMKSIHSTPEGRSVLDTETRIKSELRDADAWFKLKSDDHVMLSDAQQFTQGLLGQDVRDLTNEDYIKFALAKESGLLQETVQGDGERHRVFTLGEGDNTIQFGMDDIGKNSWKDTAKSVAKHISTLSDEDIGNLYYDAGLDYGGTMLDDTGTLSNIPGLLSNEVRIGIEKDLLGDEDKTKKLIRVLAATGNLKVSRRIPQDRDVEGLTRLDFEDIKNFGALEGDDKIATTESLKQLYKNSTQETLKNLKSTGIYNEEAFLSSFENGGISAFNTYREASENELLGADGDDIVHVSKAVRDTTKEEMERAQKLTQWRKAFEVISSSDAIDKDLRAKSSNLLEVIDAAEGDPSKVKNWDALDYRATNFLKNPAQDKTISSMIGDLRSFEKYDKYNKETNVSEDILESKILETTTSGVFGILNENERSAKYQKGVKDVYTLMQSNPEYVEDMMHILSRANATQTDHSNSGFLASVGNWAGRFIGFENVFDEQGTRIDRHKTIQKFAKNLDSYIKENGGVGLPELNAGSKGGNSGNGDDFVGRLQLMGSDTVMLQVQKIVDTSTEL